MFVLLVLTFPTGASECECNLTSGDFEANQVNTAARGAVRGIPRWGNREHNIARTHAHTHAPAPINTYIFRGKLLGCSWAGL